MKRKPTTPAVSIVVPAFRAPKPPRRLNPHPKVRQGAGKSIRTTKSSLKGKVQ